MALITTSGIVTSISGTVGGVTFSASGSSSIVRRRAATCKQASSSGAAAFAMLRYFNTRWLSLTGDQVRAWNTVASRTVERNRLGTRKLLSGKALFVRVNMLARSLTSPILTPPQPLQLEPPRTVSFTSSFGTSHLDFTWSGSTQYANVYFSRSFRAKTGPEPKVWRNWRFAARTLYIGSAINLYTYAVSVLGALSTNEWYCGRVILGDSSGRYSQPFQKSFTGA